MPISLNSNTSALLALLGTSKAVKEANEAMEKLSTGKRINSAKDDAAGVAISSRLDSSVRGLKQSTRNALDAQALLNTAEGGMKETEAVLQRLRELSVQAANDTNSTSDRKHLDDEAKQLLAEIDRIANSTTWAGQKLLDGSFTNKVFQIGGGSEVSDQLVTSIGGATTSGLALDGTVIQQANETTTIQYGLDDSFVTTNGSEASSISAGLQTYLTNTFPTTPLVDFDDSQTNSFKAASFDLISVTGEITGAVLKLRAIPLDDNRGEGNDKIIVSGFDASGNSIMPSYNIGLGVDAGPNNYFDFDWQIDGRPAHPSEGYEILIDLSDFSAQEGTGLSLLENIKAQKLLDVVLPPDTMVDYVRLEVTTADSSSQVTEGSIKNLDITVTGPKEIPLSSNSKFGTSQFSAESNGDGFLISWSSVQPGGGAGGIYLQKTDDTGLPIGNRITIDDGGNVQHPQSIALDNGNTAFTYNKYVSGRYQTKILILDADLNVLSNTISHSGEASGDYINARLDDLGNSKFALKWDYTPNHPQQPTEGSKIQIFNYDGSKEGSSFPISQTGQTYAAQEISSFDVDYLGTLITSNVGGDRELSFDVYDLDTKSKLNSVLISDGADNDYFGPYHVKKTPNGFSVSWTEGSSKTGYVQFFDKLGVATGDALTIGDNINRLSEVTTRTLENGSAISEVFWGTTNDDGDKITNYSLIENYNPSSLITKNEVINGYNSVMIPGVSSGGSFVLFSNESFADPIRTFTVDTAFHNAVDLTGMSSARSSISIIDQALNRINSSRSNLGAISNRLDHVVANNTNIATNLTASMGRIQDADYAAESTQLVKNQLIQQSSVAMIAQANASKEDVLQLIEGD